MTSPSPDDGIQVRTVWPPLAAQAAVPANQFVVSAGAALSDSQQSEGSVYLLMGHLAPPVLTSPEDVQEFTAAAEGRLEITVAASVVMPHARAVELYHALGRHLGVEPS